MKVIPLPLESRALGWTHKVIITYADMNTVAALNTTLNIFPDGGLTQLPTGTMITRTGIRLITPFLGGAIATATLDLGDKSSASRFIAAANTDLFTALATNGKDCVVSSTVWGVPFNQNSGSNAILTAKFTTTVANLTALTQGRVEIYLGISDAAPFTAVTEPGIIG